MHQTPKNHPMDQAFECLREVFGFLAFRGDQEAVVEALLGGRSTLLLMPTGMGKSLCFQLPARLFNREGLGFTLVISPLIALMKDQVDAARLKGLQASFINSSLNSEERRSRYRKLAAGEFELLYVTPERFRVPEFREALGQQKVALLAIDEAHCISAWGHDFRPDYSRLGDIRRELGDPLTLALTATATPEVQKDILLQLHLEGAAVFNRGVRRPNLQLQVFSVHAWAQKIQGFVALRHQIPGPAIVYFSLISSLEKMSHEICRLGIEHTTYHGQLGDRDRKRNQETFLRAAAGESGSLILATPAFGLGIDKENIRLVVHAELPGSLESYYQEVGRAGRDGLPAAAALLYDPDDFATQKEFLNWANPDPGFIQAVYNLLERNPLRARQEGFDYLRTQMNFYNRRDFRVETAVGLLERWGAVEGRRPREWTAVQQPPAEYLDVKLFEQRKRGGRRKLEQMQEYAALEPGPEETRCRMQILQEYFGEAAGGVCGHCDLCLAARGGGK